MLVINDHLTIPRREFEFSFARSSGPGGQNVNKVNSKAVLRWNVMGSPSLPIQVRLRFMEKFRARISDEGEIVLTSDRFRDQGRNVEDCLEKLRGLVLEVAVAPKKRRPTRPGKGAIRRRIEGKRHQSQKKSSRRGGFSD